MKVIHDIHPALFPNGVVIALGNFDGIHLGHRAILSECAALAHAFGVPSAVMTFEPHPREFFSRSHTPLRLYSLHQKLEAIRNYGIQYTLLMRFNQALAATSADAFVDHILHQTLHVKHVVTGYDFAFGKGRSGNSQFLTEKARALNFGFTAHAQVLAADGNPVSSSAIRACLTEGNITTATAMLGHRYYITGHVQHGEKRGRTLGYPTLNLSLKKRFRPRFGVYAARVHLTGEPTVWEAVASIGVKPTFGETEPLLEAHCFGMNKDVYGRYAQIELVTHLRDEKKFATPDALIAAMRDDAQQAKEILARHGAH